MAAIHRRITLRTGLVLSAAPQDRRRHDPRLVRGHGPHQAGSVAITLDQSHGPVSFSMKDPAIQQTGRLAALASYDVLNSLREDARPQRGMYRRASTKAASAGEVCLRLG
jgi:hypothetical protein